MRLRLSVLYRHITQMIVQLDDLVGDRTGSFGRCCGAQPEVHIPTQRLSGFYLATLHVTAISWVSEELNKLYTRRDYTHTHTDHGFWRHESVGQSGRIDDVRVAIVKDSALVTRHRFDAVILYIRIMRVWRDNVESLTLSPQHKTRTSSFQT